MSPLVTVFLAWVLPLIIGAKVCVERDRSLWWVVLLGWIGLIAVLVMPMSGKPCPRCAETVRLGAAVCKHCGHEFDVPVAA